MTSAESLSPKKSEEQCVSISMPLTYIIDTDRYLLRCIYKACRKARNKLKKLPSEEGSKIFSPVKRNLFIPYQVADHRVQAICIL